VQPITFDEEGRQDPHCTHVCCCCHPQVIDELDTILDRLHPQQQQQQQPQQQQAPVYRKALFFVDNSGADVVLGMLPLARELLQRGTVVVLAANRQPSINDITAAELQPLLQVKSAAVWRFSAAAGGGLHAVLCGQPKPFSDDAVIRG
jgi:hypothetical protein